MSKTKNPTWFKQQEESDFEIARLLQQELEEEEEENKQNVSTEIDDRSLDVRELFLNFDLKYFHGQLSSVVVEWSNRMRSCAGICSYEKRGGFCVIRLSEPLLKYRSKQDIIDTLLHEMIHAYLFVTANNIDRESHGPEFHKLMYDINKREGAHVTVYHSFHDEVDLYKVHWWKCDGACATKAPYFGMVKRSMNRPPSKSDDWFEAHQRNCGGTFVKVREPTNEEKLMLKGGNKEKTRKRKEKEKGKIKGKEKQGDNPKQPKLTNFFKKSDDNTLDDYDFSEGVTFLESDNEDEEEELILNRKKPKTNTNTTNSPNTHSNTVITSNTTATTTTTITSNKNESSSNEVVELCKCPNCQKEIEVQYINAHLDECLSK